MRALPLPVGELRIAEVPGGLDLDYSSVGGYPGVVAQVLFEFSPGGVWETDEVRLAPGPGQVVFLKRGYGRMIYGNDSIAIGPGACGGGHMAGAGTAMPPRGVLIVVTLTTPIDYRFSIRARRGLAR